MFLATYWSKFYCSLIVLKETNWKSRHWQAYSKDLRRMQCFGLLLNICIHSRQLNSCELIKFIYFVHLPLTLSSIAKFIKYLLQIISWINIFVNNYQSGSIHLWSNAINIVSVFMLSYDFDKSKKSKMKLIVVVYSRYNVYNAWE